MSFIPGFQHDVLISYAWADNMFANRWISNFQRYLVQRVRAGLDREGFREIDIEKLDIFIDKKGFASVGRVAEIVTHARNPAFLIICVGRKYARSAWCAMELAAFAEAQGSLDAAIGRTWTVVLEREALQLEPEGGPNEATTRLAKLLETGIQNRFFDEDGRTIRAFSPIGEELNPTGPFIDRCQPIVDHLVAMLTRKRLAAPTSQFPPNDLSDWIRDSRARGAAENGGPDIFVSYARDDKARIAKLVAALERHRWSVFWDQRIPTGQTWRSYIGRALKQARCVIVAWSEHSIDSDWVTDEAEEAKRRGILLPVLLGAVDPPYGFRSIQAADLSSWVPEHQSDAFDDLVADLSKLLG